MLSDFPNRFIDIVNQIEENIPNEFEKKRMVNYDGNIAALSASFTINNEKKWLGIMPTGRSTHCHEFRLVYACPTLSSNELEKWWNFICKQQEKLIPVDENHEFSLVSLILVCSDITDDTIKNIKKLENYIKYNKSGENGWSNARMIAIDLEKQKIYTSKNGDVLLNTLKNIKL